MRDSQTDRHAHGGVEEKLQVSAEARRRCCPDEVRTTGSCEPDMGARNQSTSTGRVVRALTQ